jgi:hypothetical protein
MPKMTDDILLNQIERLERQAVGYYTGQIAAEQATAMNYYLGKPFGTEEEGRSQVVSSDVWDAVEGMTPMVLRPFVASEDVVRFNPVGPDDEQAAQQESDYINWVVTQKNDVFNELMAWVKTGLLQKNGVVKYWWEKSRSSTIERYFGVEDDVYTALIGDDGVEVTEHTETAGPDGAVVHDVTIRVTEEVGEAKYCVIPPEELLISKDARSPNPQVARFVQHRRKVTISELREMGYDVDDDISDAGSNDTDFTQQYQARRNEEENNQSNSGEMLDPASREVMFRETFMLVDYDGDGIAELRKVCSVGRKTLANEETEEIPFCGWTPYTQPFKFYGRCPADETAEIQLVKSTVLRQTMDNIYTINNNRNFVSNKVNLDDLLDNQIAGVVRVDSDIVGNHVVPAPVTPIGAITMPMIEYFDSAKENRTGFTRYNQGTDADSLNKTATGVRIIKQAGDVRNELVSRSFAEQGLAPLMRGIHGLCRRHATKAETVRLRGEWVEVDPRGWKTRKDLTVSVGLGNADQQMKLQAVQMLGAEQKALAAVGIVTPENFYNNAAKMVEAAGFKNPEQFFTHPQKMPPAPQQPNPEIEIKQGELQIKGQSLQIDQARLELEKRKVDILDRDSLVKADVSEAEIALQAQAQGIDLTRQLAEAVAGIQAQLHQMQLASSQHALQAQAQAHAQEMAQSQQAMDAQAQDHGQQLAVAQHALSAQGQDHSQQMAEQQAAQAAESGNEQA